MGRSGRGVSQVEKLPRLKWNTQFLRWHNMLHIPLMFLSEWREFPSAPCHAEKKFMTTLVSMLLKSRASPNVLHFSLCNKKRLAIRHMNTPLFPTKLSIPSYDIRKYVGKRTYQHPLIFAYKNISLIVICTLAQRESRGTTILNLKLGKD